MINRNLVSLSLLQILILAGCQSSETTLNKTFYLTGESVTSEGNFTLTSPNTLRINSTDGTPVEIIQLFQDGNGTAAAAVAPEEFPFRLSSTAAVAAGVFLVSAVIGYLGCVGYRRHLQRKYGNSQVLKGEETYDTTDLRYFEI